MALILGNFICVSRPFRIVSGVTLNANIKIEGMGGGHHCGGILALSSLQNCLNSGTLEGFRA